MIIYEIAAAAYRGKASSTGHHYGQSCAASPGAAIRRLRVQKAASAGLRRRQDGRAGAIGQRVTRIK